MSLDKCFVSREHYCFDRPSQVCDTIHDTVVYHERLVEFGILWEGLASDYETEPIIGFEYLSGHVNSITYDREWWFFDSAIVVCTHTRDTYRLTSSVLELYRNGSIRIERYGAFYTGELRRVSHASFICEPLLVERSEEAC